MIIWERWSHPHLDLLIPLPACLQNNGKFSEFPQRAFSHGGTKLWKIEKKKVFEIWQKVIISVWHKKYLFKSNWRFHKKKNAFSKTPTVFSHDATSVGTDQVEIHDMQWKPCCELVYTRRWHGKPNIIFDRTSQQQYEDIQGFKVHVVVVIDR